ncbi:MAG: clostripain-related cysteine peptidase [bacterium]
MVFMRKKYFFLLFFGLLAFGRVWCTENVLQDKVIAKTKAAWSVLVYIAADNNLAPYALYNINDMSAGMVSTNGCNVLVQWDKPRENKTWRYQITPGSKIDAGSISSEMGYNTVNELVASMKWVVTNYPADKYALILWDHGSGIADFMPGSRAFTRGILYDDSQRTCLTNQGLTTALAQIKALIGHNLDILATDACLMAMAEVAYQVKDSVDLFIGSQETIPGNGYSYSKFIKPLSTNPAGTTPLQLAQYIINGYANFYTNTEPTSDFTLSSIDVTKISSVKTSIDLFVAAVNACSKLDAKATKNMIVAARKATISFAMPEYVDLYSFYANVLKQLKTKSPKSALILDQYNKYLRPKPKKPKKPASKPKPKPKPAPKPTVTSVKAYKAALEDLKLAAQNGINQVLNVVAQNSTGPVYSGVGGVSIYYPRFGSIHSSYPKTLFAKNTAWSKFILAYR